LAQANIQFLDLLGYRCQKSTFSKRATPPALKGSDYRIAKDYAARLDRMSELAELVKFARISAGPCVTWSGKQNKNPHQVSTLGAVHIAAENPRWGPAKIGATSGRKTEPV
jgi:hypothetical protein